MKREAQPTLSVEEQQAFDHYAHALQQMEDLSMVTIRNYLSDLRQQVRLGKRTGTLHIIGKRKKVRDVPLNATTRSTLSEYLATLPQEYFYLFPSEKTQGALGGRALGHLITKYAKLAQIHDVSPHDLRHRFGYRMAAVVLLHRLAQLMGHDSLDTMMVYIQATTQDLQQDIERIAWR